MYLKLQAPIPHPPNTKLLRYMSHGQLTQLGGQIELLGYWFKAWDPNYDHTTQHQLMGSVQG